MFRGWKSRHRGGDARCKGRLQSMSGAPLPLAMLQIIARLLLAILRQAPAGNETH
jgi:hypothetical protein